MTSTNNKVIIENENLFRALACTPIAVLMIYFSESFLMSSGIILFKIIFVLLALYFSLSALAYAAYYTNEVYAENTKRFIASRDLFKALVTAPLAIVFWLLTVNSIASSAHIVFTIISLLMASYFSLSALAYAAFYTNDHFSRTAEHAG